MFERTIMYGMRGSDVGRVQSWLNFLGEKLATDQSYGPATKAAVIRFQAKHNLKQTGNVDEATWNKLKTMVEAVQDNRVAEATFPGVLYRRDKGTSVKKLQEMLNSDGFVLDVDGSFGPGTQRAVKAFQKRHKIPVSGCVDLYTWQVLLEVSKIKQPIYKKKRAYLSNVHVFEFDPRFYHIDFEVGVRDKLERPSTIGNNLRAQGKDVVAMFNLGFFAWGGNQNHLGSYIDEGKYYQPPHKEFIDVIWGKDNVMTVKNYHGYDGALLSGLQRSANWMAGLSYSVVRDGTINLENVEKYDHGKYRHPRTLVGQKRNGNFVVIVIDGRSIGSRGVTAKQSAQIALDEGCWVAVNADGGGSSSASVFNGEVLKVVNKPSDKSGERAVASCLAVHYRSLPD